MTIFSLRQMQLVMKRLQRGLSIIELMVSLAIGSFLIIGATQIYVKSRNSYETNDAVARLQETARYAMNTLEQDIRMANYWGQYPVQVSRSKDITGIASQSAATSPLANSTSATACGNNFATDLATPIQGDNNGTLPASLGGGAGFLSNTITTTCAARNDTRVLSSDTLTIRRAADNTGATKTLLICSKKSGYGELVNLSTNCWSGSQVNDLNVNAYYVDNDSDQRNGYPSLRRKTLITGPAFQDVEIASGIEDMQIQFGIQPTIIDNANSIDGVAARYVNPDDAALNSATMQIVAVKVWLMIRSENTEAGFVDSRTYEYGDRLASNGTTNSLNAAGSSSKAYAPSDNYRRLLVSRTFQIRNSKVN